MTEVERIENITKHMLDQNFLQEQQLQAFKVVVAIAFKSPLETMFRVMEFSQKLPEHDPKILCDGILIGIAMRNLIDSDEEYHECLRLLKKNQALATEDSILQ